MEIEVSKIKNGSNIRNEKDEELRELAKSINENGLINPITVQKVKGGYEVVSGHRRFEAVKMLRWPLIECVVTEYELNAREKVFAQLAENVQRKNMSAYELVDIFNELIEKYHLTQEKIAALMNKSPSWVSLQYKAVKTLDAQYGAAIPVEAKKKSSAKILSEAKKKMTGEEIILCKGMRVVVKGHQYVIYCTENAAENALRAFLEKKKV